jgi:hypothetical protein
MLDQQSGSSRRQTGIANPIRWQSRILGERDLQENKLKRLPPKVVDQAVNLSTGTPEANLLV